MLRPADTVQKLLISTTSHFVGVFEGDGVMLALAWPGYARQSMIRWQEGPLSRNAFVFAFETEPIQRLPGTLIPDHSPFGDVICSYLAVLYGKRFDSHGALENQGSFRVPELGSFAEPCNHVLPQNSRDLRADFAVPLNLAEVSRIQRLITGPLLDSRFHETFQAAAKFYLRALQAVERDPEAAYLSLITVGEIVSNWHPFEHSTLLDADMRECLDLIRNSCPDGPHIANRIQGRLRQIKRRFVECFVGLFDDAFFGRSELTSEYKLEAGSFRKILAAAYDLRSKYLHTGKPFGYWISPDTSRYETQFARPVTGDSEFDKLLAVAPTYLGLERLTRYALLRFAESNGAYVDPPSPGSTESA